MHFLDRSCAFPEIRALLGYLAADMVIKSRLGSPRSITYARFHLHMAQFIFLLGAVRPPIGAAMCACEVGVMGQCVQSVGLCMHIRTG